MSAHQGRELGFHAGEGKQTWLVRGLEFHEQIDVALGTVASVEHGPEQGEPRDVMAGAKRLEVRL